MARARKNPIVIKSQGPVNVVEMDLVDGGKMNVIEEDFLPDTLPEDLGGKTPDEGLESTNEEDEESTSSFQAQLDAQIAKERETEGNSWCLHCEGRGCPYCQGDGEGGPEEGDGSAEVVSPEGDGGVTEEPEEGDEDDLEDLQHQEPDLEAISLDIRTLKGDVRSAMLDQIRAHSDYARLPKAKQRDIAWTIERTANHLVTQCLQLMNQNKDALVRIKASVGDIKRREKDGDIEMKVKIREGTENEELLLTRDIQERGFHILITPTSEESYRGEKKSVDEETVDDQGRLIA